MMFGRKRPTRAKWAKWAFSILIFVIIINFSGTVLYILKEYFFVSNGADQPSLCSKESNNQWIPSIIHQIYGFKNAGLSQEHRQKREKWITTHSNFTNRLWDEAAVKDLLKVEYPQLYPIYESYDSWIQRADVARYVILYHYGGWYVDLDVICKRGFHELVEEAYTLNRTVVLHTTAIAGISNDVFGITPRHAFLKSVLQNLKHSNRWFVLPHATIMLSAGSTYMWGRYLNYPCKDDVIMLADYLFNRYFQIEHDGAWHSWDDTMILFILKHNQLLMSASMALLGILSVMFVRITIIPRSNSSKHRMGQS